MLLQIINLHLTSAKQTKISHRRSTYGVCACMLLNTIFGRRPSLGVQKPGFRSLLISFVTWVDSSRISGPRFLCKRRQYLVPCLLLGNAAGRGLESVCVGVVLTFDTIQRIAGVMLGHPDMLCNTRLQPSGRLEPRMGWGYLCPHPFISPSVSLFLAPVRFTSNTGL